MARYTDRDGAFRELELDGAELCIRTGDSGGLTNEERLTCEGPAAARWEHDRRVALAIAGGFRPAAVEAPAGERHAELEATIQQAPEEPEAYLVYADWLQARGDPRGELICVQHAIAEHRQRSRTDQERYFSAQALSLERAELLLLMNHREQLLGPVLGRVHSVERQRYVMDLFELEWRLGFICRAVMPRSPRRWGEQTALWNELLQSASARFIRAVELDWADLDQLAAAELPPTLDEVSVVLDSWWPPEQEDDAREVERGGTLDEAVGAAATHGPQILAALEPLLGGAAPGLRRLALRRCAFGAALLEALARAPLREHLHELDLSHGALTDADLPRVQAHARSLRGLQRLDLRRNRFSPAGRASLRELGPQVVLEGK